MRQVRARRRFGLGERTLGRRWQGPGLIGHGDDLVSSRGQDGKALHPVVADQEVEGESNRPRDEDNESPEEVEHLTGRYGHPRYCFVAKDRAQVQFTVCGELDRASPDQGE